MIPEVFLPGIISGEHQEHSTPGISPDGTEIYWSMWTLPRVPERPPQAIYFIRNEKDTWSTPQIAPFSGTYMDGGPCFTPDGQKLIFYSNRPVEQTGEQSNDIDLWMVEKTKTGWSHPEHLGIKVDDGWFEATHSVSDSWNLYFASGSTQSGIAQGSTDIYVSKSVNNSFTRPENLGSTINTPDFRESNPCIAPDESYLIFTRDSRQFSSDGKMLGGSRKMMISFKGNDGEWQAPVDMGPIFNDNGARFPGLTPDTQYLFFTRYVDAPNEDIFWIDAKIIDQLKPKN